MVAKIEWINGQIVGCLWRPSSEGRRAMDLGCQI